MDSSLQFKNGHTTSDEDDTEDTASDSDDTTDTGGVLTFAKTEAEQNVKRGILARLPSRRVVFILGATTGSVATCAIVLLALYLH